MKIQISIEEFLNQFNANYDFLYENNDEVAGYEEAVNKFDEFLKKHRPFVLEFIRYRGDIISSDREAAAFMFTMDDMS